MEADSRSQSGFTLLEVLVAFVIMAMILGVLLNLNSVALDTTSRAEQRQQALMLAQSQLDKVLANPRLQQGRDSGRFDDERFEWEVRVRRFEFPDQVQDQEQEVNPAEPYEIELSVYWGRDQSLTLNTLRLVRPL